MTSELIDLANGLGKIAVDYGGLGGLVVALGTLGYSFYSKREDSNTTRMPIQAEIVKITQAQQSDFLINKMSAMTLGQSFKINESMSFKRKLLI